MEVSGFRMLVSNIPYLPDGQALIEALIEALEKIIGKGEISSCSLLPSDSHSDGSISSLVCVKTKNSAISLYEFAKVGILDFWCYSLKVELLQNKQLQVESVSAFSEMKQAKMMPAESGSSSTFRSMKNRPCDLAGPSKTDEAFVQPSKSSAKAENKNELKCETLFPFSPSQAVTQVHERPSEGELKPMPKNEPSFSCSTQNSLPSGSQNEFKAESSRMPDELGFSNNVLKKNGASVQEEVSKPQATPSARKKPQATEGNENFLNCKFLFDNLPIYRPTDALREALNETVSEEMKTQPNERGTKIKPEPDFSSTHKATSLMPESFCILNSSEKEKTLKMNHSTKDSNAIICDMHLCCQTSETSVYVLHSTKAATVDVLDQNKKIGFRFRESSEEYKMELVYTDIKYITKANSRGGDTQTLLLHLRHAPRIYHKACDNRESEISRKQKSTVQWVRTTDYTASGCLGQSSALCLEVPKSLNTTVIRDKFVHFREVEGKIFLERGKPYVSASKHLQVLSPPENLHIPYSVIFKLNTLVQSGNLSWPTLDDKFFRSLQPQKSSLEKINQALATLEQVTRNDIISRPHEWLLTQLEDSETSTRRNDKAAPPLETGQVYVNRVIVTPLKIYFSGPEIQVSNCVLRRFADHAENFLRVSFVDENFTSLRSTDLCLSAGHESQRHTKVYRRISDILKEGIVIGNKKFEFLAYSSSQLRENSLWMFASTGAMTAESIRKSMGNFWAIKNVAKCASRMGQAFSSSTETFDVPHNEFVYIRDIESEDKKYNFSDGIGKISKSFAEQLAQKCGLLNKTPSVFQIRYAGFKGVVAVDPTMSSKLALRRSMRKYTSSNQSVNVLAWSSYRPCHLNRQIIVLLSTLGVKDDVFLRLQEQTISLVDEILTDRMKAINVLQSMYTGKSHNVLTDMLACGYCPRSEPYLSMMLQAFRASKLLKLKTKSHIFVPKGQYLMGCLDETRTLKYGEVFIQVSRLPDSPKNCDSYHVIEGNVVVTKNPCLHPGDIRVLKAVKAPQLQHMVDCIVFPQEGKRPHPNECSGSDLDGDLYFVSWEKSLIPPQQHQPMDYSSNPVKELDHEVTMQEIQEHFINYMVDDTLGVIANAHLAFADQEEGMAMSSKCLSLAELHSTAVDFPKTGVPAEVPQHLYPKQYPDFMEKEERQTYPSKTVLGKLYRRVKESIASNLFESLNHKQKCYDLDLEVPGFDGYLDEALEYKKKYDVKLYRLMDHYEVSSEAEILSGNIERLLNSMGGINKRKHGQIREEILGAVNSLTREARRWFEMSIGSRNKYMKASAWYHVAYHQNYWRKHAETGNSRPRLISFPWVLHDILLEIKSKHQTKQHFL